MNSPKNIDAGPQKASSKHQICQTWFLYHELYQSHYGSPLLDSSTSPNIDVSLKYPHFSLLSRAAEYFLPPILFFRTVLEFMEFLKMLPRASTISIANFKTLG